MMYDVLLTIIETFPYNDGKIYNHQLKNNINKSIHGEKYPIIGLKWSLLHPDFIENLYLFMIDDVLIEHSGLFHVIPLDVHLYYFLVDK